MRVPKVIESSAGKCLPLERCFAKTQNNNGQIVLGCTVYNHCLAVGIVATQIAQRLPSWFTESLVPSHIGLLCALHDIGKVYPPFQVKLRKVAGQDMEGLVDDGMDADKLNGYHFTVTYDALFQESEKIAFVLGRHHGTVVSPMQVVNEDAECLGGLEWASRRKELVSLLEKAFSCHLNDIQIPNEDIASGIVTLADWIASDERFGFVSKQMSTEEMNQLAINALASIPLFLPAVQKDMTFQQVFGFPPRQLQSQFEQLVQPGRTYILEAPMGCGKTEAALFSTYCLLQKEKARGLYYALPTRVTADQIYERVNQFLDVICGSLDDEVPFHAQLLHGLAYLELDQADIAPGGSWFSSLKRSILASCGVGTIDQALLSVMRAKYNYLRTLGLAGKVVIIDEVHSYDAYTGTLLKELVHELQSLQCTVFLLSATLTSKLKGELLSLPSDVQCLSSHYPSVSYTEQGTYMEKALSWTDDSVMDVHTMDDDVAYDSAISAAFDGEQVLWIENTIQEAQNVFRIIGARVSGQIDIGLLHSAFTLTDRSTLEAKWISLYGKNGKDMRSKAGRILIGTQVLEQSLDIDADRLYCRFCPIDFLLQRCGRVFRHKENDSVRPHGAKKQVIILPAICKSDNGDFSFKGKTQFVYDPYVLCRTYEVLRDVSKIKMPSEIPSLIEKVYDERQETDKQMGRLHADLESRVRSMCGSAMASLATTLGSISDDRISTRLDERPKGMLLLIKRLRQHDDMVSLLLLNGETIELVKKDFGAHRKNIAKEIMRNCVSIELSMVKKSIYLTLFSQYVYVGDIMEHDFHPLFGYGIVASNHEIHDENNTLMGTYDEHLGFVTGVQKKQE